MSDVLYFGMTVNSKITLDKLYEVDGAFGDSVESVLDEFSGCEDGIDKSWEVDWSCHRGNE